MKRKACIGCLLLITILLSSCIASNKARTENASTDEQAVQDMPEMLTLQLISWFHGPSGSRHDLYHRISRFQEAHPNVKIYIQWSDYYGNPSPWVQQAVSYKKHSRADDMPDIIELVPNQMRFWYRYGIIEPLNIKETALRPYIITSYDGYVLGLTTKINPLIAYYNKDVFPITWSRSPFKRLGYGQAERYDCEAASCQTECVFAVNTLYPGVDHEYVWRANRCTGRHDFLGLYQQ